MLSSQGINQQAKDMLNIKQIGNEYIVSFFSIKRFNTIICEKVKTYLLQFVNESNSKLILNFQGIKFVDSCGFETLLTVMKAAEKNGGSLQFMNVSEDVKELIELLQLTDKFQMAEAS